MKTLITLLRPVVLGTILSLLLTACASERVKAEAKKAKENKDEYVDYYPVGSNLPIRVPKDSIKTTESETDSAQRALKNAQQAGQRQQSDPTH